MQYNINDFKGLIDLELHELIAKADNIRQSFWGKKAFFIKNIHLNYTNICVSHCRFCAFSKDSTDEGAYCMEIDDILKYIALKDNGITEVHIVGGLHPDKEFSYYTDMLKAIKSAFPKVSIKSFSAVEIDYFSKISSLSIKDVLLKLKSSGLDMLPGGGAEIFEPKIRQIICPEKINSDRWIDIHRTAHKEGITSNATMLYSHVEDENDRLAHLIKLRNLQDETGGFSAFIPLSFQPEETFLAGDAKRATGFDDIKVTALSRIVLENIPHIKAYWVMLGKKTAQIALRAGADDLDGTILKENIAHAAGGVSDDAITEGEFLNYIKSAGLIPVERDSFYGEIKIYG